MSDHPLDRIRTGATPVFQRLTLPKIEEWALLKLRSRMEQLDQKMRGNTTSTLPALPSKRPPPAHSPQGIMSSLLEAATSQTLEETKAMFVLRTVRSLTPDEARILSILADGRSRALINITAGSRIGPANRPVLNNVCTIIRSGGILWQDYGPHYIQHLLELGLVEIGPEDNKLLADYQLLESEDLTRRAVDKVKKLGQRTQITHRTLLLSDLGRLFWNACNASPPNGETDA